MNNTLESFTDVLADEIGNSQPLSLPSSSESRGFPHCPVSVNNNLIESTDVGVTERPSKCTGQRGQFRSIEEIDPKYRDVFSYPYFNLVQSRVIEDALYSDKSIVVCAPTGSGKTVVFEMAIVQLLMELEDKQYTEDFKIIYMAPVKALCTERLTEWYSKFTKLGLMCIEVTGDTDVDFSQLKPYKIIITTPEKWDMLTRRWRDHRGLVEVIKLFLIDEVHILNDETRGPVLEAVVSRMKTIESSAQSVHRIEQLQKEIQGETVSNKSAPRIRFVAVSATVSNPEDVATWLGTSDKPAVFYKFGDECRPVKLKRIVEGYPCAEGTSIFKFDIILNYKLWPIIQKYHCGKPTLIFCNTRKSVILTAETLSRELTISFNAEQKAKLTALASTIKNKTLQALVMSGVGCHHAGLLYEERQNIEFAFRNRDLPILITTTTLAMGVNLPAHLVIVKNTQQYVNGAYQEYSISTVLQMVGRAGRPQFDTEATAVIMTRLVDKPRYQALVGGCEPLQSFLHKRLPENLNSEAALGTVGDVAQCVQWLRSTFLYVRAARDPKKYLGLSQNSPQHLISKKIEELCVKAMNSLASSGLISMDEASCIESTEAGRLMSIFYLDLETMKQIMKVEGSESLERLLVLICESHELADMHLRVDERRCLNLLNRNQAAATIRFPMKGKISTRQMKLNCIIQAVLGCLPIPDPSLNQEAMKIMRIADRVCKCLVTYVTRPDLVAQQPLFYSAVLNSILLAKCVAAHLWENSPYVSKQLKGIGPTFSTLLASAGKVNFILLEESHPRDLERIMNKGAPAGNVLRKQVSLLPKYQLTMIPVDEKTVTLQLLLINQSYLAENMGNLTAGESHKSYIIVGDSNNHLLLLATFKDKDLICVFDGIIRYEIRRKHNFEHKIFAHCISSSFVGIDAQAEYLFNDLEPFLGEASTQKNSSQKNPRSNKKLTERQTCITDTFKERKRKNTDAIEKSKEKKKRESAMIESFKYLKQSFETASRNVNQSVKMNTNDESTNNIVTVGHSGPSNVNCNDIGNIRSDNTQNLATVHNSEEMNSDEFIDEEKIDSILNEIENEMNKDKLNSKINKESFRYKKENTQTPAFNKSTIHSLNSMSNLYPNAKSSHYSTSAIRKRKPITAKSNYNFIELLERKLSLSDNEDIVEIPQKNNGFSDTIKNQIQKYLTETKTTIPDRNVEILAVLDNPQNELSNNREIDRTSVLEQLSKHVHEPYPTYVIKEILGQTDSSVQKNKVQETNKIACYQDGNDSKTNKNDEAERNNKVDDNHELINCNINIENVTDFSDQSTLMLNEENYNTKSNDKCPEEKDKYMAITETKNYTEEQKKDDVDIGHQNNMQLIENGIELIDNDSNSMIKTDIIIVSPITESIQSPGKNIIKNSTKDEIKYNKELKVNECACEQNNAERVGDNDESLKHISGQILPLNLNQPVANNRIPISGFRTGEDFVPDLSSPLTKCGQSVCASSVSSFFLPPSSDLSNVNQTTSNHFSKNIGIDQRKSKFVQRFSYVTSKIDICTKQTPEYSMQVIKKLKMDVDITAIVSRKHDCFQNSSADSDQTSNNDIKRIELLKQEKTNQEDNGYIIPACHTRGSDPSNIFLPPIHFATSESSIELTDQGNVDEVVNSNMRSPNIKEAVPEQELTNTKTLINNNANEILPPIHQHLERNDNCENLSIDLKQTVTANALVGENKVQNILQKYSKKLSTNTTKLLTPSYSNTSIRPPEYNNSPKKSRKPFKITDLHKLHASLPDTIVENKRELEEDLLQSAKMNLFVDATKKLKKINKNEITQNTDVKPIRDISGYASTELDIETINEYISPKIDLEPKVCNIDQSMFNPKTLLQCVADDGHEIVPPPPEFCDDISYSPVSAGSEEDLMTCGRHEMLTSQLNASTIDDEGCSESIFDDKTGTNLTPSKEIETWILSQEDYDPESNITLNISPTKSYTVMRKNYTNSNFSYKNIVSRQAKLGKFRFSQKSKFKTKK